MLYNKLRFKISNNSKFSKNLKITPQTKQRNFAKINQKHLQTRQQFFIILAQRLQIKQKLNKMQTKCKTKYETNFFFFYFISNLTNKIIHFHISTTQKQTTTTKIFTYERFASINSNYNKLNLIYFQNYI